MEGFESVRVLGGGGGGVCSLMREIETGDLYVLKTMYSSEDDGNDIRKAIEAERRMADCKKVKSAYLVEYVDFFKNEDDGSSNIVMEYCPGGDLLKLIYDNFKGNTPIPYPVVKKIIAQSVVGLFVLHRAHIMHRDIKPENIFVLEDFNVKIGDFGTGKQLEKTIAEAKTIIGTKEYQAPEVQNGQPYTLKADIYSLGLVFIMLITLIVNAAQAVLKPITRTDIPQGLKNLLNKMKIPDPEQRPDIKAIVHHPIIKEAILELPRENIPQELLDDYSQDGSAATTDGSEPEPDSGAASAAAEAAAAQAAEAAQAQALAVEEARKAAQAKAEADAAAAAAAAVAAQAKAQTDAQAKVEAEAKAKATQTQTQGQPIVGGGSERFNRLTDAEYQTTFKMSRAEFNALSEFKRITLRRQNKLFGK